MVRSLSAVDPARALLRRGSGLVVLGCMLALSLAATPAQAATTLVINPFASATTPAGVAVDPAGDVYIADSAAGDVLKVTPAGTTTVVASGLNAPSGVAVNPSNGALYIADTGDHVVKELSPTGTLTVVAGTGTAGTPVPGAATASPLGGPSGLATDSAGDLYIADGAGAGGNPYVEKVTPGGTLSILAGSGTRGTPVNGTATHSPLRTPTGVAVDASGNVFVADTGASLVLKVTPAGALTIFAGRSGLSGQPTAGTATSSKLNGPTGLATDAAGDLYIADTANNRVEEVTAADKLSLFAGTGVSAAPTYGAAATLSPLTGPAAIATTPTGLTYVADSTHATVDRIAPALPALGAAPTPTGTAKQGQALTATPGTRANAPTTFAYGWERCNAAGSTCIAIAGANGATYTLTADDAGATIRSLVTATNVSGASTVASTPTAVIIPLAPVSTAAPGVAGTATNLQTLAASPGAWSNTPTAFAYKWEDCDAGGANCTAIAGATASTYTLALSDVGDTIRVLVTATNAGGSSTPAASPATAVIAPVLTPWANTAVPTPLSAPSVSGSMAVGGTLSCAPGRWSNSPTSYEYRWNRGNAPIVNATGATYTVTAADRGQALSCTVTAINAGGAIQADSARVTVPAAAASHTPAKGKPHKARKAQQRRALTHRRQRARATADARRRRQARRSRHSQKR